ncbi:MAG: MBOAT family O-acyltransferase [Eubacteriales bacterium]|nr:MBOAT family O-acyltransferase [Eubacteriales bacterium]
MSFQSMAFAAFLAAALLVFYAVPAKGRLLVLFLANLIFFEWTRPSAGIWLFLSVCTTWGAGLFLRKMKGRAGRRLLLIGCLAVNFGLLAVFKYLPVWDRLVNEALGGGLRRVHLDPAGALGIAAPLGISFYTLQAAGYLLDVAKGRYEPEKNWLKYAVFVSFFPNILSGPIERGGHFLAQLERVLAAGRRELLCYDRIAQGLTSMLLGYFMKLVVADRAALLVDYLYGVYENGNSFTMLMAALFYSVQIYCDFASYSLIAVGVGRLFGFELLLNFCQPYLANSLSDFWRRWHISLSSWLRDYVYIPLGGNRKGVWRKELNLVLVFLASGLWHGGAPHFLVWGLLWGLGIAVEDLAGRAFAGLQAVRAGRTGRTGRAVRGRRNPVFSAVIQLVRVLGTFLAATLLWIFFRSDSLEIAFVCFKNLFTGWLGFSYAEQFLFAMGLNRTEFWIAAGGMALLFILDLVSEKKKQETAVWIYRSPLPVRWGICLLLLGAVFAVGMYGQGFHASSFIYVNF